MIPTETTVTPSPTWYGTSLQSASFQHLELADEPTWSRTPGGATEPSVLLVDDNPANLIALEAILEPLGVRLAKASSGEQALRLLLSEEFAVILLDVQMTGMDGYETAALIKQRERTRNVPIIFLTAYGRGEAEVQEGYAHGAVDYLQKPFSSEVLRSKVSVFIELFRTQQQVRRQTELLRRQEAFAREAAHRAAGHIARLQALTSVLAEATCVEQVMRALFEQGLTSLGVTAGSVCLLDETGQNLEVIQSTGYSEATLQQWRSMPLSLHVPLTDAVREGRPQWLGSEADWAARYPHLAVLANSCAAIALPLLVKGRGLGAIGLSFDAERVFTVDDRAFFHAMAHACAQAIDRARLYEEERLSNELLRIAAARLQVLAEATDAFSAANRDLPALFDAIAHQVVCHLGDSSLLSLLSADGQQLEPVSLRHMEPGAQVHMRQLFSAAPVPANQGLLGKVARSGQSLFIPVTPQESLLSGVKPEYRAMLEHFPVHSFMAVPLRVQGRVIGALAVSRHTPGRPFTSEDQRLLEELADKAALSIENARLFQQQQRDQEELRSRAEFEQQLIGIVSHDLRNPLGAITMAAGLLEASPGLTERQLKAARRIASSCERATGLIRDFLDFTQARLGTGIPLRRRPMDLHEVTQHVVDEVQQAHPTRQVHFEASGDGHGEWDPDRISQVLTNLVGNALAYSAPGTPVQVRTAGGPEGALLEVHNHGMPIAPELLPRLFEPLTRGAPTEGTSSRSIGLGLYIVREIIRGHGGRVEVRSSVERGTTFTVLLPRP
ncbi:GAF domain-containing protein [Hyalangium rubrum]|uniref:histidine kinase n=1 Tax=Hyalangium rubrum TaxID=3103134 RepID=A0ABU5HDJ0_9BACT|nr:GAF domain-containing protein [Hyalangium sp. s54d21]MDY7230170.1 GAF domain-containing protein [Hyalangium sp. s54d21]